MKEIRQKGENENGTQVILIGTIKRIKLEIDKDKTSLQMTQ